MEGERSWCGSLVKMAKGADIGAHGNGISFVPRVGASPSLLLRGVVWKVSLAWSTGLFLCFEILFFSHVLQPSADVKFGSVFSGETVSKGHVSACSELESVELGGFVHTHSETFSVKGPHLFIGLFSYPLVAGANSSGLGLPCVLHLCRTRVLSSSLLLMYVEEEGAQDSSLIMAKDCVMSSRSWCDLDLAAAIDGSLAPLVKSVLAGTCAARWEVAKIQGLLALTYARKVDLFFGRHACLHSSVNGEYKGLFSGKNQEVKVSVLQVLQRTLQVIQKRGCSLHCDHYLLPFGSCMSDACSRVLGSGLHGRNWVPCSSCVRGHSRILMGARIPVCWYLLDPGGLVPGLLWACSGTSDQEYVVCFVDTSQL